MVVDGYDLDLSYITDRLLAMSFPAQNMEAIIRNPMWQVQRALDSRHGSHYKVYNLCQEAVYDPENFHGRVECFPFDDNHVPPLHLVKNFCESVQQWLNEDSANVAVIHCRAGKGRTGLMLCSYLVYEGMGAEEALQRYANERTYNNEGVTIASQRRYVGYWSKILTFPNGPGAGGPPDVHLPAPKPRELRRIRLYDTVNIDTVKFVIHELQENVASIPVGLIEALLRDMLMNFEPYSSLSWPTIFVHASALSLLTLPRNIQRLVIWETKSIPKEFLSADSRTSLVIHTWIGSEIVVFNFQAAAKLHGHLVPGDLYVPAVQIASGFCKTFHQGLHRTVSPRYYLSFLPRDGDERNGHESHQGWVVQMGTDKPVVHKKACLDYYFDKPLVVAGDIRAKFFDKSGGRLFYACFNTFFIANSIIQLGRGDLDKVGKRAKAICGSGFCLELLFGPTDNSNSVPVADNSF